MDPATGSERGGWIPNPQRQDPGPRGWFARFPLKTLVLVSAACLALGEEFPFSHFPMYSSFSRYSYYVYVTDRNGDPVPLETVTSVRVAMLKKVFQSELDAVKDETKEATGDWRGFHTLTVEERRPAAEAALGWLEGVWKDGARPTYQELAPVTFHQVSLEVVDDDMQRRDEALAVR